MNSASPDNFQNELQAELREIAGFAQVNLFEPIAEANEGPLRWWSPLACAAAVAALAWASALWLTPQATALAQRVENAEAQVQNETKRIEAAARQSQGSAPDQARALQAALGRQERLLAALGGGGVGGAGANAEPTAQDFSALLEGLAHTRVDGLWLTQVRLDRRSHEVRLEGQTRDAKLVSAYIDDLSRNARFKGLVLAAVDVSRPAAHSSPGAEAVEPTRFKLASAVIAPTLPEPAAAGASNRTSGNSGLAP